MAKLVLPKTYRYVDQLSRQLKNDLLLHEPGRFVAFTKPYGISSLGFMQDNGGMFRNSVHNDEKRDKQKERKEYSEENRFGITIDECLPELRKTLKEPNLSFSFGLKRYLSGPIILPCNEKDAKALKKCVQKANSSDDEHLHRALVITLGKPDIDYGKLHGYATFQAVGSHKEYIFEEKRASRRAKSGKFAVEGSMEYQVLGHNNGCSLVEIGIDKFARHLPRLMLCQLGMPVLGDVLYCRRVTVSNGKTLIVNPKHLRNQVFKYPETLVSKIAKTDVDVLHRLPLYFHVTNTVFSNFDASNDKKNAVDLVLNSPPPAHFLSMLEVLGLKKAYEDYLNDDHSEPQVVAGESRF